MEKLQGHRWHCLLLLAITMALCFNCSQPSNRWHYSVNKHGLKELYSDVRSDILGTPCVSRFKVVKAGNTKGGHGEAYITIEFTVSPFSKIKGFGFDQFEGPHAPAGRKKLMKISVTGKGKPSVFKVYQAGWINADVKDGFTFSAGAPVKDKNSVIRKIMDSIMAGGQAIEVSVTDPHAGNVIRSVFPAGQGRSLFEKIMM